LVRLDKIPELPYFIFTNVSITRLHAKRIEANFKTKNPHSFRRYYL